MAVVVLLSVQVGHLVGAHKERYFKLKITGLDSCQLAASSKGDFASFEGS